MPLLISCVSWSNQNSLIDIDVRRITNLEFESYYTDQYERYCTGEFRTLVRGMNQWGQLYDMRQAPICIHDVASERVEDKFEMIRQFNLDFIDEDLWENYEELKKNAHDKIKKERQSGVVKKEELSIDEEVKRLKAELSKTREELGAAKGRETMRKNRKIQVGAS